MKRRAVFLDRDGVLNSAIVRDGRPYSPSGSHEVEIPLGVPEACERLRQEGFVLLVVTNQPEVARGRLPREAVEEINDYLRVHLPLDDVRVCYHDDRDGCDCRKPKPGLLLDAARDWNIDLTRSFLIGDRWRDIEAGRRAGCRTIFIDHKYSEPHPSDEEFTAASFPLAVDWLLASLGRSQTLRGPQVSAVSGLYGNSLYLMAASVASAAFGFLFWTAAARLYPASEVGIAAATLSAVGLMAMLAALGLDYALIRFLPHAADAHELVNSSLTVGAVAGGLASLVFLVGLDAWSPALVRFRANFVFDAAVVVSVVGTVMMGMLTSVYLSRLRAAYALGQSIIFGTVKVALAAIFAMTQGVVGLLGAWALGSSLAWLAGALVMLRRIEGGRYRLRPALRRDVLNLMAHFAFPNYLASLFWSAPMLILPLLVVNIVGPEAGAYFYVTASVSGLVAMIPTAVSMSLFAEGSHDPSEVVGRALVSARFALMLLVPAIAGVFLFGSKVLLIFGRAYSDQGTQLLWVLALASLPLAGNFLFLSVRRVQQRMGGVVAATAWILVATLVLSALLLPRFGLLGVGIAWFAAQASTAAVVLIWYLLNSK